MSSGQKPRVRTFFPRMKVRRPHRRRPPMVVLWSAEWDLVWFARGRRGQMPDLPFTITTGGAS